MIKALRKKSNIVVNEIDIGFKYRLGVKESKGEIITFLEDGDIYERDYDISTPFLVTMVA